MKVLFVAHGLGLGGASSSLINLIEEYNNSFPDIEIYVLIPNGKALYYEKIKSLNCHIVRGKYYRWGGWITAESKISANTKRAKWSCIENLINNITAIKLARYVKKENIDIIHSNSSIINEGALIAKYSHRPHVWHFREFLQEDQDVVMWCSEKYFKNTISKYSDVIISVSNAVKQKYEKLFPGKIKTIYNGVPYSVHNIADKKNDEFNIVQVGKICESKGQDIAVKAIEELIRRGYKQVRLILVGTIASDFSIPEIPQVIMKGQMTPQDIGYIRSNIATVEIVCSKQEAFGRVTIEAMMAGLPVVGANSGGTKELIKDRVNGLLFENRDYIDLANKLEVLINNSELLQMMSEEAKIFAKEFTIQKCANNIVAVYRDITSKV